MNSYSCYYEAEIKGCVVQGIVHINARSPRQARVRCYDTIVDLYDAIKFIDATVTDEQPARQEAR